MHEGLHFFLGRTLVVGVAWWGGNTHVGNIVMNSVIIFIKLS